MNGNGVLNRKQLDGTTIEDQATTDINRWRLNDDHGRHTWHYLETEEQAKLWPQTPADRYHLGLSMVCTHLQRVFYPSTCPTDHVDTEPTQSATGQDPSGRRQKWSLLLF